MSDRCQFDLKCTEEALFGCPCTTPPQIFCNLHLSNHFLLQSAVPHNIKPLLLTKIEEPKAIILLELIKLQKMLIDTEKQYSEKVKKLISSVHEEFNKGLQEINSTREKLNKLIDLVQSVSTIRLNKKNPDILQLFTKPADIILNEFNNMKMLRITFLYQDNKIKLDIKERISENLEEHSREGFSEGVCLNNHKLLVSLDSCKFYSFLNGGSSVAQCDECKLKIETNSLHCRKCFYDLCDSCAKKKKFTKPDYLLCENHHALGWIPSIIGAGLPGVNCNICNFSYQSSGWRCIPCDYDMCNQCAEKRGYLVPYSYPLNCNEQHKMLCASINGTVSCSKCNSLIKQNHYRCEQCNFSLCSLCSGFLGYRLPICSKNHQMSSHTKSRNLWGRLKTIDCTYCLQKIREDGLVCNTCKEAVCEECFLLKMFRFLSA